MTISQLDQKPTNFQYPKGKPPLSLQETQKELDKLRQAYKASPDKITLVRGKLMKYSLELKLKKTGPSQLDITQ